MRTTNLNPWLGIPGAAAASLAVLPALTLAEPGQHKAHVHGAAELTLAAEDDQLEMRFTSPAVNIVGFEHTATTAEQIAAVENAKAQLSNVASLFGFAGTACALQSVTVDMSAVLSDASDAHSAHTHDSEAHDSEEHDVDAHEPNGHQSHTDIDASYLFRCESNAQLTSVSVGSEGLPFGLDRINAMWVSGRGQGSTVLTPQSNTIKFD